MSAVEQSIDKQISYPLPPIEGVTLETLRIPFSESGTKAVDIFYDDIPNEEFFGPNSSDIVTPSLDFQKRNLRAHQTKILETFQQHGISMDVACAFTAFYPFLMKDIEFPDAVITEVVFDRAGNNIRVNVANNHGDFVQKVISAETLAGFHLPSLAGYKKHEDFEAFSLNKYEQLLHCVQELIKKKDRRFFIRQYLEKIPGGLHATDRIQICFSPSARTKQNDTIPLIDFSVQNLDLSEEERKNLKTGSHHLNDFLDNIASGTRKPVSQITLVTTKEAVKIQVGDVFI